MRRNRLGVMGIGCVSCFVLFLLTSPKEKEQFLDDLAKAAGQEKDGNRLVRRN